MASEVPCPEDPRIDTFENNVVGVCWALGRKVGRRQCTTRGNWHGGMSGGDWQRGPGACLARPASALRELERCNRLRTIWVSLMERESISVDGGLGCGPENRQSKQVKK